MLQLIYSPHWFYGKDIIIDIVSVLVLFLIAFSSLKYYKINKTNKNYLIFASAFGILALSFIFKIITNFSLYYTSIETMKIGLITYTFKEVESSNLFSMGFLIYRALTLIGLLGLSSLYAKTKKINIIIIIYFILISTYFSRETYYLFHLSALLFLAVITIQYWQNYQKTKHNTNKWLFLSFSLITLSQIIFIFIGLNTIFYVVAESIQLLGYIALLTTFIKVLNDGKKKRAKRYHT